MFLITDTQIKEESFLEDIDSLLNTGEVPQLFAADEKAEIMEVWHHVNTKRLNLTGGHIVGKPIELVENEFQIFEYIVCLKKYEMLSSF